MIVRDVLSASLRKIGALAPGESLPADEAADALAELNRMLSSWSTERLMIPSKVQDVLTLTPGDPSYSMGTGGDIDTSRPLAIQSALLRIETMSPAIELPITILTSDEWAAIPIKEAESDIPSFLYSEGTSPLETLNLYPRPLQAHKLVLYSWKPLSQIATLDTELAFLPGYEDAIVYNLAIRLAPDYGKSVSAEVATIASDTKANLKRMNIRPAYLRVDSALLPSRGFNVLTGDA